MKLFRHISILVCIVATLVAHADEPATPGAHGATKQSSADLQLLQGTWEGVQIGDPAYQRVTITVASNSLHFHRDTNFWFKTTITLPAGTEPRQLHATIKDRPASQSVSTGQVVKAFFKIENGTWTLATMGDDADETMKSFENAGTRYELWKVPAQKKSDSPKTK